MDKMIPRIKDWFLAKDEPDHIYVVRLYGDSRSDDTNWEYAIPNQIYVSAECRKSDKSDVKPDQVAYEIVYPDGQTDVISYSTFDEIENGHYLCPNCDSYAIMSVDALSGKVVCSDCGWHNHDSEGESQD
jgi:hypothetical protein